MCKACHALPCEDRHHRKINCSLQNALAEKAAKNLHGGLRCAKRGGAKKSAKS